MRAIVVAALVVAAEIPATAAAVVPARAPAKDFAIIARDIVPSGEPGSVPPPPGADRQALMYDALTPLFNHVTDAELPRFFKPETLGTATPGPVRTETVPHPGVTIVRDGFDVPHVHGVTRDDVTWGAGWVLAEDRALLLNEARYDARVAAIDVPGVDALGLVAGLKSFKPTRRPRTRSQGKPMSCLPRRLSHKPIPSGFFNRIPVWLRISSNVGVSRDFCCRRM